MKTLTAAGLAVALPFAAQAESGVLGLDRVALTVPEMAQARAFFEDGLGCVHAISGRSVMMRAHGCKTPSAPMPAR